MSEKFWYLKSCALFERLEPADVALLESHALARRFHPKQSIYLPNDRANSLLIVASGRVKLFHLAQDGKETILALVDPGEVFGEMSLLEDTPCTEFAEAMAPTQIVLIPDDVVRRLMEQRPQLVLSITKLIGLRLRRLERRLKSLFFHSTRDRLVHALLDLASQYGRETSRGVFIDVRLSHQDLANLIGSTRESVTLLLGQLTQERLLFVEKRMITLRSYREMAQSIDEALPELPQPAFQPQPAR